jgi:hypothetical protein
MQCRTNQQFFAIIGCDHLPIIADGEGEMRAIEITLSFNGGAADKNEINFYDVSQALIGFERSLALTTHLVLNGEIITQAPALKGAEILAIPPTEGSWKLPPQSSSRPQAFITWVLRQKILQLVISLGRDTIM